MQRDTGLRLFGKPVIEDDEMAVPGPIEVIHLSEADWTAMMESLMNPPEPNEALRQAFKRNP